ncbi:RIP metalloprotease RseP [Veillonella agrestimuris]|uniref:RIP metalloprotease RseP n=1 Tax=Veillonella agrestimuris TaxID=2941340 RepID=UPI0020424865|nr:RIP metalloprotease RseP [Veillonella agrestimuris]
MITALATIFVFGLIVFIHELGHFVTAKLSGMQVDEFAIGFGPVLVKVQYGETLYSIRAIPLGGFNRIAGMSPEEPLNDRSFYNKPAYQKFIVISAGAIFNFLLAIIIFFGINVFVGSLSTSDKPIIGSVISGEPAALANLRDGDVILSINDKPIAKWEDISVTLKETKANHGVPIVVSRDGESLETTVVPKDDGNGIRIGIYPSFDRQALGVGESFTLAVQRTGHIIESMVLGLKDMIMGTEKAELSGPVGISQMAGSVAQQGFVPLLAFAALLSINLGIINLLPLPVLDGGHLVIILVEAITRRKLPPKALMYIQMAGVAMMIALFVYVTTKDIIRLL